MRRDLLQPSLRALSPGDPHAAHQLGLADVHRGHPGYDLVLIHRLGQHRFSSPTSMQSRNETRAARGDQEKERNLVLVLDHSVGNNEGPTA